MASTVDVSSVSLGAAMGKWYLYLIRTRHGTLYAGTTTDVGRRLLEHDEGGPKGSRYLRYRGLLELVYQVEIGDRSLANRAEFLIKRLTKRKKEEIVSDGLTTGALLELLGLSM